MDVIIFSLVLLLQRKTPQFSLLLKCIIHKPEENAEYKPNKLFRLYQMAFIKSFSIIFLSDFNNLNSNNIYR